MDVTHFIGPWISLLVILVPFVYAERWIHQHFFGIGYLLTGEKGSATGFYYLIFFPGVILHEIIQYLVAGALNVPVKKIEARPQVQENGTLRYDFVTIEKTDPLKASIIGGAPFLVAASLVYYISTSILDLHSIPAAFSTNDLQTVLQAIQDQFNTPDFWLWMGILFSVSNGMIPTKEDRAGWWLILGAVGVITIVFLVIGLDSVLIETYNSTVRDGLELVTTSLTIILGMDIVVILLLGFTEDTLERMRGFKMDYSGPAAKTIKERVRKPGSNLPLPKGELMPSVYNLQLPIPNFPAKPDTRAAPAQSPSAFGQRPTPASQAAGSASSLRPAASFGASPPPDSPDDARPARPTGSRPSADRPRRPAASFGASPSPDSPDDARPARPTGSRPSADRPRRPAASFGASPPPDSPDDAPFARPTGSRPSADRPRRPAASFGASPPSDSPDDAPFARPTGSRPSADRPRRPAASFGASPSPDSPDDAPFARPTGSRSDSPFGASAQRPSPFRPRRPPTEATDSEDE